jgi:predicted metal-dependent peptidase
MRTPIVDWRKELEVFIDDAVTKSKYTLPSRRFLGGGKAQYGYKRYKEDFESMVVAIDTSGSISDKMVEQFLAEVRAIVESYSPQDLYIIYCHTSIYRVDHIEPGDPIEVGSLRSGGTEFYPPFKWTQENLLDMGIVPSVFIYFTDGEATFPSPSQYGISEYEDRVIWVLLTWNGRPFGGDIPFGNRIDITLPNKEIKSI